MKVKSFVRKYHNKGIEDAGAYRSAEFGQFAKDFTSMMRDIAKSIGAEIDSNIVGHYFVTYYLEADGKYCYVSYSVPRGGFPVNCMATSALFGILVREARDAKDYTGGQNRFCNFDGLQSLIEEILKGGRR